MGLFACTATEAGGTLRLRTGFKQPRPLQTTMKLLLLTIVAVLGLISCASKRLISPPDPGKAGIVLETEQTAEHKWG